MSAAGDVSGYYDANTRRFLRYGQGGAGLAIHRAVWAEGVENRAEAMDYVYSRVLQALDEEGGRRIFDIGCGVGGGLLSIAARRDVEAAGLTISGVQRQIGEELIAREGMAEKCRIHDGDFLDPSATQGFGPSFDAAMAVESFIHMADGPAFFRNAASLLRPGGELLLCDDFLNTLNSPQTALLKRFREGWHAEGLRTPEESISMAVEAGFELKSDEDLTDFLELGRPRDILIRAVVAMTSPLPLASPFWRNLRGGDALQRLLSSGVVRYRLLRFKKRAQR